MPVSVFPFPFELIVALIVGFAVAAVVVVVFRSFSHRVFAESRFRSLQYAHLLITVPKEASKKESKEQEHHQQIQEQIAVSEVFFSSIGGLHAQRGLKTAVVGRDDHISFEIVANNNLISFYVVAPRTLAQYVEQQIHAQFPEAHIEETADYNIFSPAGVVRGSELTLTRLSMFPIKTYKQMESDPLNAITNALSRIREPEGAVIQFIVRSAMPTWRKRGVKVASKMQQGMTIKRALWVTSKIGRFFWLVGSTQPSKSAQDPGAKREYRLSPKEEEIVKGVEEKASKAGMDVNIRVLVSAQNEQQAQSYLDNITNAFTQYSLYQYGNTLVRSSPRGKRQVEMIESAMYRTFNERTSLVLNTEEIASVFHFPLHTLETPNIRWLLAKKLAPPVNMPNDGLVLGKNIYRGSETIVRMKPEDRRRHLYIIGTTGSGKSNLLTNLVIQDIKAGQGVAVIDPHGTLIEDIIPHIPRARVEDVVYFDPSDVERPVGLNMLEAKTPEARDFAVQEMIAIFYKLVTDPAMIGPMFEHSMRNAMLTLMADEENPGTLVDIPRMFTDTEFQKYKLKYVKDPIVRAFWEKEMAKTSDFHKSETLGYLISKVGRFIENEMIRNIIGQPQSGFDIREIMDEQKILLVNLSKGKVGEMNSNLLGLIIVSKLQVAALARADMPESERKDFYLYIDEFQNFVTDSIATILAEARKYRLDLTMAHQYLGQLETGAGVEGKQHGSKIRDAIFGNVGSMACFRIGPEDSETMAKQFAPTVNEYDLINLERFHAYIRLLIDNTAAKPFHFVPDPPRQGDPQVALAVRALSRLKYGRDRAIVESEILERSKLGEILEEVDTQNVERTK